MITLIPIEPRNEAHGALIIAAFNKLFINRGGEEDGWGNGGGFREGDGYSDGGYGDGNGNGSGYGCDGGSGGKPPEEWLVGP
jgi:hypothetical protein